MMTGIDFAHGAGDGGNGGKYSGLRCQDIRPNLGKRSVKSDGLYIPQRSLDGPAASRDHISKK